MANIKRRKLYEIVESSSTPPLYVLLGGRQDKEALCLDHFTIEFKRVLGAQNRGRYVFPIVG